MRTRRIRRIQSAVLAACLALAGCRTYEPEPLEPEVILDELTASRRAVGEGEVLDLAGAAALLPTGNPRILEARAAHRFAVAVAETPTPLPNPTLEAGLLFFDGSRRGLEAALGWAIPVSGRLRLTDERNVLEAEAARVEAVAVEREEFLGLRRELVDLVMAVRTEASSEDLADAADASVRTVRRLIDAAQGTALDLRQTELEALEARDDLMAAREGSGEARAKLAARTGVGAGAFRTGEPPPLPDEVPSEAALRSLLGAAHPGLARLRAAYSLAEKDLQLEIARQIPDLEIALTLEREPDGDKVGLPLGIEVPIFDRNQPGIAAAEGRRAEARVRFRAEASRALAAIEAARSRVEARRNRLAVLRSRTLPAATEALALARRALAAGAADALQFLAVLRAEREVRVKTLEAERALYEAWFDLEEACGAPLLAFPERVEGDAP
jgi:cobalt-zinc-cadmium efflux system outer membrane protein